MKIEEKLPESLSCGLKVYFCECSESDKLRIMSVWVNEGLEALSTTISLTLNVKSSAEKHSFWNTWHESNPSAWSDVSAFSVTAERYFFRAQGCWIKAYELEKRFEHENIDEYFCMKCSPRIPFDECRNALGLKVEWEDRQGETTRTTSCVLRIWNTRESSRHTTRWEKIDTEWKFTRHNGANKKRLANNCHSFVTFSGPQPHSEQQRNVLIKFY